MSTKHYDFSSPLGKTELVLDNWKSQAALIDNDVIASSHECPIMGGIENTANTLKKNGAHFTTIPLNPLSKDVNFLMQNYITIQAKLTFTTEAGGATTAALKNKYNLHIFTPSTACLPSRIMLLCGNSILWSNQYQREEAICTMNSLPAGLINKSSDYTTTDKLLKLKSIPGAHLLLTDDTFTQGTTKDIEVMLTFNIDLSHLTPLISNIMFTTPEMGELRLRLFFDDLEQAFNFAITPVVNTVDISPIVSHNPLGSAFINDGTTAGNSIKVTLKDWEFVNKGLEIVQSCFAIRDESKIEIKKYIAQDNKLIIPTQTWSTFTSTTQMTSRNPDLTFLLSAYNINTLVFLFPNTNSSTVFTNPYIKTLDVKYNSKSITFIPYSECNKRMLKDTVQALINDDYYAANDNLLDSILPGYLEIQNDINVAKGAGVTPFTTIIKHQTDTCKLISYPNKYCVAFQLSPINSFEKGFSPASSNQSTAQVRVKMETYDSATVLPADARGVNPTIYKNLGVENRNAFALALCDCCLVLDYNPIVGSAQSGSVVFAEPFII